MTSHYTWRSVTTLHDFGGVLGRPLDTFFGLSQFHGHGSWLVCEVALVGVARSSDPCSDHSLTKLGYCIGLALPAPVSECDKSRNFMFQVLDAELRCNNYKRWKCIFSFSFKTWFGRPSQLCEHLSIESNLTVTHMSFWLPFLTTNLTIRQTCLKWFVFVIC